VFAHPPSLKAVAANYAHFWQWRRRCRYVATPAGCCRTRRWNI